MIKPLFMSNINRIGTLLILISVCFTSCNKDNPGGKDPSSTDCPENVIKYRTMDLSVTTPHKAIGELVSNEYKDGWGRMEFAQPVTSIPAAAFYENTNLVSIELSNKVTSIGGDSFKGCSNLISATTGNGITSIGERAFEGCSSLKEFAIADGVSEIQYATFTGCKALETVYVGQNVKVIDNASFYNCANITKVYTKNLKNWCEGGFMKAISAYSYGKADLYVDNKLLDDIIVPEGVSVIHDGSFMGLKRIKTVSLPETVTYIMSYAFDGCEGLEKINFPASLEGIGHHAFTSCTNLERVDITSLEHWCSISFFEDDDSYSYVSNYPFQYSKEGHLFLSGKEITDIVIPASCTVVGDYAFWKLKSIKSVKIHDSITRIGLLAFKNCASLESLIIPDSVKLIDSGAFSYSGIADVTLGKNVNHIGYEAFRGCANLRKVTLTANTPPVLYSYDNLNPFSECSALESIIVPKGTLSVYQNASGWSQYSALMKEAE